MNIVIMTGRVAGQGTFIPGHVKNGQFVRPQYKCGFFAEAMRSKKGDAPKEQAVQLSLWGVNARNAALTFSQGKHLTIIGEVRPYKGRVFIETATGRQALAGPDGQPLLVSKAGIEVRQFRLGNDSRKVIQAEIAAGQRPPNWDDGAAGSAAWSEALKRRMASKYDGTSPRFGYGTVLVPSGAGVVYDRNLAMMDNVPKTATATAPFPQAGGQPQAVNTSFYTTPGVMPFPPPTYPQAGPWAPVSAPPSNNGFYPATAPTAPASTAVKTVPY